MPVTQLISGGLRAGTPLAVTVGASGKINVTSVVMNGSGASDFGFNINALATTWYLANATNMVFYNIPAADISTSANPMANSTTSFSISNYSTSANTLLDDWDLEQGYFTSQIPAPIASYMAVWQGFLVCNDVNNPNYIWFSSLDSPNIWSTYGNIQGDYEEIDSNDGDIINGFFVNGGYLYAFKHKSTFMVQYTQNTAAPYYIRQISVDIGNLSHWSSKEINDQASYSNIGVSNTAIAFLSARGPAKIIGTMVTLLPASADITDRFNPTSPTVYNLAAMEFTTAGINVTKSQIFWGISTGSSATRNATLVYDYQNQAFWEDDVSANVYTEITDTNFFPSVWSGDYSANIWQHDQGLDDGGIAIPFNFFTPVVQLKEPFFAKRVEQIHIAGAVQTAGNLYVDVYLDFNPNISITIPFDMTNPQFKSGLAIPLGMTCSAIQLNLRQSDLDVPVQVDAIGFSYESLREKSGAA